MWRLYGADGSNKDYEIFKIPFIQAVDKVSAKIRNLTYRYMPNQLTLFPTETQQYNNWMLRELLHNCIAHADYRIGNRIYVNEFEDKIDFVNPGSFLPGTIEPVLRAGYNPPFYRNQLLTEAMTNFRMIDTAAMGIRKVFFILWNRYFPLPDYALEQNKVAVTVYGKLLNENYSRVLFLNRDNPDFDLNCVFLIDRVQKKLPISKEAAQHLRSMGIIEGKYPNIFVSASVAAALDKSAQYIKNKGFDDSHYCDLVIAYLKKFKRASKKDIRGLLFDKLSDVLDEKQKEIKVKNLLQDMRRKKYIQRDSQNNRTSNWILGPGLDNSLD